MVDSVTCPNCRRVVPVMGNPTLVRGPETPNENLLTRARSWAYESPFSRAEPVAADLMRELIQALERSRP